MKRTRLKAQGKVGRANTQARKLITEQCEELNLNYCEIALPNCLRTWPLAPAHRHKRAWYKGDVGKLSDYNEWVVACINCHNQIEHDAQLTEEVFNRLRP